MEKPKGATQPTIDRRDRATLIGATAVLMWSLLASLAAAAKGIPPFQLLAMTFTVAFLAGSAWIVVAYGPHALRQHLRQPRRALLLSLAALYLYHALYFVALDNAPPAEASLINYLWPLLIVMFSAPLAGERLGPAQIIGAVLGFAGTALLILDGAEAATPANMLGYVAAFGCALIWSLYSVLNRRHHAVSSTAIIGVCGLVALLGALSHFAFEPATIIPNTRQWFAALGLGIGPVGLAFLVWDHGAKHGRIALLGVLSYGAPLLSTLLLVALGWAEASLALAAACLMIMSGAALASRAP
jgi:drug/metabolite transporter (DMT)-like permease